MLNCVCLETPWTVAHQASLSMGFPRQEYWSGLPFPPPGDHPNPRIEPPSPTLADNFFINEPAGKPTVDYNSVLKSKEILTHPATWTLCSVKYARCKKTLLVFTMKPKSCNFLGFSEARGSHVARFGQRVSRNLLKDWGKDLL